MENVEPISPQKVTKLKEKTIPPPVIEAFNDMIVQRFDGRKSSFLQKEVVSLIMKKMGIPKTAEGMVYQKHWLDVEDVFKQKGWHVEYDKPAYNETYEASFTFKARPFPPKQRS